MKYDILDDFKLFLENKYSSSATVRQYHFRAVQLLSDQSFSELSELDFENMAEKLEQNTKTLNEYSQGKNAFINLAEFAEVKAELPALNEPKKRKRRKLPARRLKEINSKIDVITDKKLLLSYKTMLATGLRVGELASIKEKDIQSLENGDLSLVFKPKGGGSDTITIPATEKYICDGINENIKTGKTENKAFYGIDHLQKNAKKRGFACHDLRRAFAKKTYKNSRSIAHTSEKLRHASTRTTRIYLNSKIEV